MSGRDIAGLSDEEFLNEFAKHEAELASAPKTEASQPGVQSEAQPSGEGEAGSDPVDTGGADTGKPDPDKPDTGEGTSSDEGLDDEGNDEPSPDIGGARSDPHQGSPSSKTDSGEESDSPPALDAKAELAQLMAPLKAAKRTITIENVDQARQLMQMGVDYSRKMQDMKPYQKVLKSLERADLLDEGKLNFLIDLANKRPEAIKKLLKDSEIDPIDLSPEEGDTYTPNDHMIGDGELALDAVLDDLRPSPQFDKVVDIVTAWDTASKRTLMDNPDVIRHIAAHVESGIYDLIVTRLERDRIFGKHTGLSDLDAYKAVGDAMHTEGAFAKANPAASLSSGKTNQESGQDSQGSDESGRKARKKAAGSPRGSAGEVQKKGPDFSKMTDEQIEKFDWRSALT